VLLIWSLCCLAQVLYIKSFGSSLPWSDEWSLTATATGHQQLTWEWLWRPANEHRAPLTRLAVLVLARLGSWNWQVTHFIGLISMALGSLSLLVAAREARGRTTLSDAFLCLLVLSPWHFESLMLYGYSYAIASGLLCLAISLASTRWPLRSIANLALYLLLALAVTLSAGPAGNLWALGLCGVVVLAMFEGTSRLWKVSGLLGMTIVTAVSVIMLLAIPKVDVHNGYHSQSVLETLTAGSKMATGWLGAPPLHVIWPWALVLLLVPLLLVLKHLIQDARAMLRLERGMARASQPWWGLGAMLLAALLVALAMGYGRGRYRATWTSRYLTLTQPIGILIYLLMVRLRAPVVIPQMLALGMAVCVGWCWPMAIRNGEAPHAQRVELRKTLRRGTMPLSVVSTKYCQTDIVGLSPSQEGFFLDCLFQLRESNLSVFRDTRRRVHHRPLPWPQAWNAEAGRLSGGLKPVTDEAAVSQTAIEVTAGSEGAGVATYDVEVLVGCAYQLCCRMRTSMQGRWLSVNVDNGPPVPCPLSAGPEYRPYVLQQPFEISAGKHSLTIVMPQPGMRLDLLELVPQGRR
jgi:hypothetical protein